MYIIRLVCLMLFGGAIFGASVPGRNPGKIQVLILTGYNMHDWRSITASLRATLEQTGKFEVRVNEEPVGITEATLNGYDVVVLNFTNHMLTFGPPWPEATREAVLNFVRGGKGLVAFHGALSAHAEWPEYEKLTGGAWRKGATHAPYHKFKAEVCDRSHPVTAGMASSFTQFDEVNQRLTMYPGIRILVTAFDDPKNCSEANVCGSGKVEPVIWAQDYGKGRVFSTTLGHDMKSVSTPGFIATFQRGVEWAATGKVTIPVPDGIADR